MEIFFILTTHIPVCILGYGEFSTSNKYLWLITEINKCFLTSFIYKAVSFRKRFLQCLAETEFRAKYLEAISQYTSLSLFSLFQVEILSLSFFVLSQRLVHCVPCLSSLYLCQYSLKMLKRKAGDY